MEYVPLQRVSPYPHTCGLLASMVPDDHADTTAHYCVSQIEKAEMLMWDIKQHREKLLAAAERDKNAPGYTAIVECRLRAAAILEAKAAALLDAAKKKGAGAS